MKKIVMIGIAIMVATVMVAAGVAIVITTSLVPEQSTNQGSNAVIRVTDIYFKEVEVESAKRMPPGQGRMRGLQLRVKISLVDPEITTLYNVDIQIIRDEQAPRLAYPPFPKYLYKSEYLYKASNKPRQYSFGDTNIDNFPFIAAWPSFYTKTDVYGGGDDDWNWEFCGYRSMPLNIRFTLEIAYSLDRHDLTKRDSLRINLDPLKNLPVHEDPELSNLAKAYDL